MDTLVLMASIIGGLIAAVVLIKLFYYTVFFLARCVIDGIFLVIATPFYILFHPVRLFINPKKFFIGLIANAPIAGKKINDEKWRKEEKARCAKLTLEEQKKELEHRGYIRNLFEEEYQKYERDKRDGLVD